MFVVDDGSTDESKNVILSYVPLFEEKGYSLHYLYQKNAGMAAAIQNALQFVNGKYLAWPDSDDFYSSNDAIEKMVAKLESAPSDVAVVRTKHEFIDEKNLMSLGVRGVSADKIEDKSLFDDCLFSQNDFYFCSGAYMVDFQRLVNCAEWPMFTSKDTGQNWQLLLPVLWNFRCVSISENLYSVLVRSASHSRGQYVGFEKQIMKFTAYSNTLLSTLDKIKGMPRDVCDSYKARIKDKYLNIFLKLTFQYGKVYDFDKYYGQQKNNCLKNQILSFFVHLRLSKPVWILYMKYVELKLMLRK